MPRPLLPLLLALLALPALLAAQTQDDRENDDPTGTYWNTGRTAADITTLVNQGWRLTNLAVDGTNPWTFTVTMVPNSGSYGIGWWWSYNVDAATLAAQLQQNNARLIDLEVVDTGLGSERFAAVMVSNTGANQKAWGWLYGTTTAAITNLANQGNRIVDLEQYTIGGVTRYGCVVIANTGADARSWWYYYNVSAAAMGTLLAQNNARVYDLDRVGSNYNVVMTGQGSAKNWRYFGLTATQVTDTLSQIGARAFDIERYSTLLGARYDVALINNSNALSTRISEILRSNTDGHSGVYLKRANGPVLAYINGERPHEPASMLKTLHHLEAMRQVYLNNTTLGTTYRTYTGLQGGFISCPAGSGSYVDETLDFVLRRMMENSDNNRTRTVTDNFGGFAQLNARAAAIGMTNTQVNHHIGCGTDQNENRTTLRDIGHLHERVINGYLGNERDNFYELMASSYQGGGYAVGELDPVMVDEANAAGVTANQLLAFRDQFRIFYKPGGYGTAAGFFRTWGGYVRIPFYLSGNVVLREYVVGSFVANASTEASAITAAKLAAAEVLRDELRAALQSWAGTTLASTQAIGAGCGSPTMTQGSSSLPRPGLNAVYSLTGAYPASPALFAIGFSSTSAGSIPLPFPLQTIGSLPGCMAYNDLSITNAALTNLSGSSSMAVAIPNDLAFLGFQYYSQWYSFDGLGGAAFKTSNGRRSTVGL